MSPWVLLLFWSRADTNEAKPRHSQIGQDQSRSVADGCQDGAKNKTGKRHFLETRQLNHCGDTVHDGVAYLAKSCWLCCGQMEFVMSIAILRLSPRTSYVIIPLLKRCFIWNSFVHNVTSTLLDSLFSSACECHFSCSQLFHILIFNP